MTTWGGCRGASPFPDLLLEEAPTGVLGWFDKLTMTIRDGYEHGTPGAFPDPGYLPSINQLGAASTKRAGRFAGRTIHRKNAQTNQVAAITNMLTE